MFKGSEKSLIIFVFKDFYFPQNHLKNSKILNNPNTFLVLMALSDPYKNV